MRLVRADDLYKANSVRPCVLTRSQLKVKPFGSNIPSSREVVGKVRRETG